MIIKTIVDAIQQDPWGFWDAVIFAIALYAMIYGATYAVVSIIDLIRDKRK